MTTTHPSQRPRRGRRTVAASSLLALVGVGAVTQAATAAAVPLPAITHCPALYVLAVQGTGQSSDDADPTTDTGMLATMIAPMLAQAPAGSVQRAYVPYAADFGGLPLTGTGDLPYEQSESGAVAELDAMAAQVVRECPDTMTAEVGYSQGANAVSQFARGVGAGRGPIPADKVGAVALFANPERRPGEPVLPGDMGQVSPSAAPGTSGTAVSRVVLEQAPPPGSGMVDPAQSYGTLTGRLVADICLPGDLSCDAPGHAALLRFAAGIAARTRFSDPLSGVRALTDAVDTARTTIIADDVRLGPDGRVDYLPLASATERLADAADLHDLAPAPVPHDAADRKAAAAAAAIAADPIGNVPRLVQQLSQAAAANVADNRDLLNPAVLAE